MIECLQLSFKIFYIASMLRFEKISFESFILLEGVGLIIVCYILKSFMLLGDFDFTKLV